MTKLHELNLAALFLTVLAGPTIAADLTLQTADVYTHRSQGDVRQVAEAAARLVRSEDGVFADVKTSELRPWHAYTMWIVTINAPENCSETPCPSTDVLGTPEIVDADLGFADGAIADGEGRAEFSTFLHLGDLPKAWFGNEFSNPDAEIHLVLRDHGPLQLGLERQMLSSFRAGCTDESVSETLPETARNDGFRADFDCYNHQTVIFLPAEGTEDS